MDVPRFEAAEGRFGARLHERLFTEGELAFAAGKARGHESLAVRLAAKIAARARNAHRPAAAISDHRNPVKRSLYPGPVVVTEFAYAIHDPLEVRIGHFLVPQPQGLVREAGLGRPPEVHHDLQQLTQAGMAVEGALDALR